MNIKAAFHRDIAPALQELSISFPIISITGPRQSGKTTLAQLFYPNKTYFNLEDPSTRTQIIADPKGMLASVQQNGAIFDEVQHYPELLSYLQVAVDNSNINGQFVITGSYNLALIESVTQSLAGRVGMLDLLPLSTQELLRINADFTMEESLYYGGMPRIFKENINPSLVYKNYVKTYLERDMRKIINVKDLVQFQRFMGLCASRIGCEFNATGISNEIGVSYHTIQAWISVLEASYIIFRLQPYYENFGKRIIKSPKLYFTDVGLASYLLGVEKITHISRDPLKGNLFENLVILDIYKKILNQGKEARLYFYRDRSQFEVDLIWQQGRTLVPIEIKCGQTFKSEFTKGLNYFKEIANKQVQRGYVIYTGASSLSTHTFWQTINYKELHVLEKSHI